MAQPLIDLLTMFGPFGADGDEAGEGEELAVQEVVVAERLVAHGGARPPAGL